MYYDTARPLTFEAMLSDPLTRLVMDADGVSLDEFAAVMHAAREAVVIRNRAVVPHVRAVPALA